MELRNGAGYSVEAILAALILFVFTLNAIQVPNYEGWTDFQRQIAAQDISYVLKDTGNMEQFMRNSDTGALRTSASAISDVDMSVSGTVDQIPINELQVGFHTMPDKIHWNETTPVDSDDRCHGDLGEVEEDSEAEVRRTVNGSGTLEDEYGARLYFADTDPSTPDGFNEEIDYDSIYVDNGTECIFRTEDGPYYLDEIFYWGNKSDDRDGKFFDFKRFDNTSKEVNVFEADTAKEFEQVLNRPLNGINTDTAVDTFNFSTPALSDNDVTVFTERESLQRIQDHSSVFRSYMEDGSSLLLMNLTESDLEYEIMKDIGFEWLDLPYEETPSSHDASFSQYGPSQDVETYLMGMAREASEVSLAPGGKVISGQSETLTSGDDLVYSRNTGFNTSTLDGEIATGETWSEINAAQPCTDTRTVFEIAGEDYDVENVDLSESSADCGEIRGLYVEEDGEMRGPVLEDEVVVIDGRRYVPRISSGNDARLVFAGSNKVEIVNHRRVFEDMEGERIARTSFEEDYSEADKDMLASVLYWLRGDTVTFEGGAGSTSLSTNVYGGINDNVYMPYTVKMRWEN